MEEKKIYIGRRSSRARRGADVVCFPTNPSLTEWQRRGWTMAWNNGDGALLCRFPICRPCLALSFARLPFADADPLGWVHKYVRKGSMHVSILSNFSVLHSEALSAFVLKTSSIAL